MPTPSPSTPPALESRYGGPIVSRRAARVLLALLVTVLLGILAFVAVRFALQPVTVETIAYEHLDEQHVSVTFQITMAPGTSASCSVQALNAGRAQVGFVEVEIPAQTERQTFHTVEIATQGDAVSGQVVECEAT